MMPLWTRDEAVAAMDGQATASVPPALTGVSIDTRTLAPGDLFFALKGDNRDGHAFVAAALDKGGIAVIARGRAAEWPAGALIEVDDPLRALEALGRAARARSQARIVAVTGSVGKTSTKEALRLALGANGVTHASAASYNNHWGVPLSLARLPREAAYGVFEIGMNHAGEITPLTQMVRPHAAIVTTVAPVHLEFFGSVEAIADAKAEIFTGLAPGGAAIINRDIAHFARLAAAAGKAGARVIGFGEHADAEARLLDLALRENCSTAHARIAGQDVSYKLGAPGRHMVMNSLAVLAAAQELGADLALAALALAQMKPAEGRGGRTQLMMDGGTATLIDESYNANPASMRAALALLGQQKPGPRGRRIAVLGDMLELGAESAALHRAIAHDAEDCGIDLVFCAGPLMQELWGALPARRRGAYAKDAASLAPQVVAALHAGDVAMVKGSFSSKMKTVVDAIGRRFAPDPAAAEDA